MDILPKKSGKFLKKNWTVCMMLTTLCALFVLCPILQAAESEVSEKSVSKAKSLVERSSEMYELEALREENRLLRKELIEILDNSREQNERYKRIQLSVLASMLEMEKVSISKGDMNFLKELKVVSLAGNELAEGSLEFCKYLDSIANTLKLDDVKRARLKLKLGNLRDKSENFVALTGTAPQKGHIDKCRILAINGALQIAVLAYGYSNGARNGMRWHIEDEESGKYELRIIKVRPYVSAAVMLKGDIKKLVPGMMLYSGSGK